jgi:hypothetical protein
MKAKKGKMPAALAKYWRTHKRRKGTSKTRHALLKRRMRQQLAAGVVPERLKQYERKQTRRFNPSSRAHRGYKLGLATPSGRLYYSGGKFSSSLPAVIFPTSESVRAAAKMMHSKHKHLRRYAFLAVPC